MKNRELRTFLAVATAVLVIYFGATSNEGRGVTSALVVLGVVAGVVVWFLTKPGKPAS
ncbi:amidophosphoribosyltransferase [Micromonospora sp. NPDC049559]|uniref:amidophosphoribosyltransferase n=1 Tax=Micromonospora sp. NPDC049559 TaxID=3155923 RepID=UPI0034398D99